MPRHTDTVDDVLTGQTRVINGQEVQAVHRIVEVEVHAVDETTTDARYKSEDAYDHDWKNFFSIKNSGVQLELCTDFQLHTAHRVLRRTTETVFKLDLGLTPTGALDTDRWYMWSFHGRLVATLQLGALANTGGVTIELSGRPKDTTLKLMKAETELAEINVRFENGITPDKVQFATVQSTVASDSGGEA